MSIYKSITPESVKMYFKNYDWECIDNHANNKIIILEKYYVKYDKKYTVIIPSSKKYSDYFERLDSAINTFSVLENIDKDQAVYSLAENYRDLLMFRIISQKANEGTLPFDEAADVLKGIKDLIVHSIRNEEYKRPYHRRLSRESRSFLKTFRLAQTGIGSFIFNIESDNYCTIDRQITLSGDAEIPIVRRAIERIQNGLNFINNEEDMERLKELSYRIGFNANMCDSLLEINDIDNKMKIETNIKYSNYFDSEYKNEGKIKVELKDSDFIKLKILSEYYKNQENYIEIMIMGKITSLNAKWKDSMTGLLIDNVISVSWYESIERKTHNCKVQLSDEEYKSACNAHRDKKLIQVSGNIDKNRTRWFLEDHKKFVILP